MSHRRSTLQKPDEQFIALANTINSQCNLHKTEWDIDSDRLSNFDALLANANAAHAANSNRATKNAVTVANKKAAFEELRHFLSSFINYIEENTKVPDTAIEFMGLRSRHHHFHQPLPRPEDNLLLSTKKQLGEITLYASRPAHGHPTADASQTRYHGYMIQYKIEGQERYQTAISTRLRHTLFFDSADRGKRVFISAAWVNPRLETGPWSDEITEIID